MRHSVIFIGLMLIAATSATPALANVFNANGVDPRVLIMPTDKDRPYAAIGRIINGQERPNANYRPNGLVARIASANSGFATGFMVSPCYALTAYHVAFGAWTLPELPYDSSTGTSELLGQRLAFATTRADGVTAVIATGKAVAWGHFQTATAAKNSDWALVQFPADACPGIQVGWFEVSAADPKGAEGQDVIAAGYPGDLSRAPSWSLYADQHCHLIAWESDRLQWGTDCAVTSGDSGGPIFYFDPRTRIPTVLGIMVEVSQEHTAVLPKYSSDYRNLAVAVAPFYAQIKGLLDADLKAHKIQNPITAFVAK